MPLNLIPPGTRKGNRYFLARGSIKNKVYEFNLYTTDAKAARKRTEELENSIKNERKLVPSGDLLTFAQATQLYLDFRNPAKAERQRIDKVLVELGKDKIKDIRAADLHALAIRMYPKGAPATRNRWILRPAITILHHAANAGLCNWIKCPAFKEPRPVTRALAPEAAAALILAAENADQRLLLTWLFFQGTRITATLKIDWTQLDMKAKTIKLYNRKGDRWTTFPIHEVTYTELRRRNDREGRVFAWSDRSSLRRWLPRVCASVGIDMTPHMARHTLGSMMAANGETLRAIMAALDHSQAKSSLRYQAADIEMVRAATGRVSLPAIGRPKATNQRREKRSASTRRIG